MFAYCGNNPVNALDSTGHAMQTTNVLMTDTDVSPQRKIIELLEWTTGNTMYYTQDEAAGAISEDLWQRSGKNNVEYCAMIYRVDLSLYGGCGYVYYSDAILRGMHDNVFLQLLYLDSQANLMIGEETAFIHSHPHCTCHLSNVFSHGDKGVPALVPVSSIYLIGENRMLQRWDKDGSERDELWQQIVISVDIAASWMEDHFGWMLP